MSFKPIDSKRDEYRKYLERTGVIEALSKVLINLFHEQEKPENAVDYLRINIGDALKDRDTIESLKQELADAKHEIDELRKQLQGNNTATVMTNTDGGGDAPPAITPIETITATAAVTTVNTENLEHVKDDEATQTATPVQPQLVDRTENEEAIINAGTSALTPPQTTDKGDETAVTVEKVHHNENEISTITTDSTPSSSNDSNNEQHQNSPVVVAAATATNDEDTSKDPPKNTE